MRSSRLRSATSSGKVTFMPPRILLLAALTLPFFLSCVPKGRFDDTVADQVQCHESLDATQKERDELRSKLDEAQKRLSDTESRNEELSQTNQLLVGKNSTCAQSTLSTQQELLRIKEEKAKAEEKASLLGRTYDDLVKTLKDEVAQGQVMIAQRGDRVTVNVADQVLFPSGSDVVQPQGKKVLAKVATVLKKLTDKRIDVEGHTDNLMITGSLKNRFPTNWELSASRATKVVRFLADSGVDPARLAAVGMADNRPVASNGSTEGRRKNRRIEIVLAPIVNLGNEIKSSK